jgi:hypothetical protein
VCKKALVLCVLRKGWNVPNEEEYVLRLAAGVKRNLSIPHTFIVLTDSTLLKTNEEENFVVLPFQNDWQGWWCKVELFHPDLTLGFPTLYLDLDTVVVGSLDRFFDATVFPDGIYFLDDFYRPGKGETGVMFWRGLETSALYRTFDYDHRPRMDAQYLVPRSVSMFGPKVHCDIQKRIHVASYKVDIRDRGYNAPHSECSLVCFHGQPRPHELGPDFPAWMKENWVGADKPLIDNLQPRLVRRSNRSKSTEEVQK